MKSCLNINQAFSPKALIGLAFFFFCVFAMYPGLSFAKSAENNEGWVSMPEGGRAAFVGVQGGTVPATVFSANFSSDNEEQTAQVGLTGNDFLQVGLGRESFDLVANGEMLPFGYADQNNGSHNLASNAPKAGISAQQKSLTHGFSKIFEEEQEPETLLLGDELTRI